MGSGCSKEDTAGSAAAGDGTTSNNKKGSGDVRLSDQTSGFRETGFFLTKIAGEVEHKAKGAAHHVRNVFATPFEAMDLHNFTTPVFPKSTEEEALLKKALKKNFVFEHLTDRELRPFILAFEKESVAPNTVLITEGDVGDYFYVIASGQCRFTVGGKQVGIAKAGSSFGELALLYNCPRAATVTTTDTSNTELFRVDQKAFRYILNTQTREHEDHKLKLLTGVPFLKDLGSYELSKLAAVMTPHLFDKGQYVFRKGDTADNFYVIDEGTFKVCNISAGESKYEDIELGPGGFGGERAIMTGEPRVGDMVALTDGQVFGIDKVTFFTVLGDLPHLMAKAQDKNILSGIKVFADTNLDAKAYASLADLIENKTYAKGTNIVKAGQPTEAALYLVRSGKLQETTSNGTILPHEGGGYVGDALLLADAQAGKNRPTDPTQVPADFTLTAIEETVCGVLTLANCRRIVNTVHLGRPVRPSVIAADVAANAANVALADLKRHTILGAGTFGQVWLVSSEGSDGQRVPYALKIQSKYELLQDGQAKAVANEKNIMAMLQHPFLIRLANTYQDDKFVYMLLGLVQGGELYTIVHGNGRKHGIPDKEAQFYAAGIAEGLGYMHRRGFVYRDLKPENVLIDSEGYTVIVDFGFAKYVADKTYTLCGTPLYLPPEVILNRGHNWGADHWSLGVLIFEMLTGKTPFYEEGMEQMDLFRAIVKGRYKIPRTLSADATSIIQGFVTKDPNQRLGSLKGGEDDVLRHPWFKAIDPEKLRNKEIPAPHVPKIKNPLDASNFDDWSHLEDKTKKKYPKLTAEQEKVFSTF